MDDLTQNIPIVGNMIRRQQTENTGIPTPINDNLVKTNSDYLKEHPELLEKFSDISKTLIKMGFSTRHINHLFLIEKFQSLDQAIDLLSKTNDLWNHNFVENDFDLCFICDEKKESHFDKKAALEENLKKSKSTNIRYNSNDNVNLMFKNDKVEVSFMKSDNSKDTVLKINVKSCPICFLEVDDNNVFTMNCKHEFCKDCIVSYIEEEIKIARVEILSCPQKNCKEIFSEEQLKSLISEDYFKKYIKFKLRNQIKSNKDLVICPIADCEGFAQIAENEKKQGINRENLNENLLESETDPLLLQDLKSKKNDKELYKIKYTCNNNHNFCGKCMKAWHRNSSCDDDKDILEFATDSGKIVKKCPNCKVWTEKDEGCNHMNCKLCSYDWCWICEGLCPPDHFTKRDTPCYGKQFNEHGDPDIEYIEILNNQNNFINNIIFFFAFTFFIISSACRMLLMINNRRNNNSKITAFCVFSCLLLLAYIFLCLSNGIIGMYLLVNLGKFQQVRNKLSKVTGFFSFFLFWFIFYFFGYLLSTFWLLISILFLILKLCLI